MEIYNTCFLGTDGTNLRIIATYSHLLPITIGMVIASYIVFRKGFIFLTGSFFVFSLLFALWLGGDVVLWTSNNYDLVNTFWYPLDFINILLYLSAVFFFDAFVLGKISNVRKIILFLLPLPIFYIALSGNALIDFNHAVCEATENSVVTYYKIFAETISILLIVFTLFRKKTDQQTINRKIPISIAGVGLIITLLIFATSEFIATTTGIYEISLYSLFVIPIYQFIIIFLTSQYNSFNLKSWNQQILAFVLVIMVSSQLLFVNGKVDLVLNVITLVGSFSLVYFLDRSIKIEMADKARIEELAKSLAEKNIKLKELDEQKSEFISLASHQLRGPLTAIKGYASLILEGDYGKLEPETKEAVETIYRSTQALVVLVGDYLDVSRIEQGNMKYDFTDFDLKLTVKNVVNEMLPPVQMGNLTLTFDETPGDFLVHADEGKIKQVITNLIDNATKYTTTGGVVVSLTRNQKDNLLISVKDTGVGIKPEVMPRLFERFSRAPDASKTNILGTGLGLYVARRMIEAHRGKIWAESEGENKGSTFYIELEPLHSKIHPHFEDPVKGKLG